VTRTAAWAAAIVIGLALAGGCAGGPSTGVSADATKQLELEVSAVRQSAQAGDMAKASAYLDQLNASVTTLQSQGKLNDAAGARILLAADAVRTQLGAATTIAPTSTAPTTTKAPTTTTSKSRDHKKDSGNNQGGD
jgi:hypothetical protein